MLKLAFTAALLMAGLTACGNNQTTPDQGKATPTVMNSAKDENKPPALTVRDSSLGKIVVDGKGRTVYTYADDKQGAAKSTCKDACLQAWPPVPAPAKPDVDKLTGDAGVTKDANGDDQLTYNGWPLYYFAADQQPGDTQGQGAKGEWWVLNPTGEKVQSK